MNCFGARHFPVRPGCDIKHLSWEQLRANLRIRREIDSNLVTQAVVPVVSLGDGERFAISSFRHRISPDAPDCDVFTAPGPWTARSAASARR
jgi:hypothetical protein